MIETGSCYAPDFYICALPSKVVILKGGISCVFAIKIVSPDVQKIPVPSGTGILFFCCILLYFSWIFADRITSCATVFSLTYVHGYVKII